MTQEEMKELLAEAWKEVFQVEEVSDDADFFEAGGDSIMAVQLSAWLIQKGVKLDLADIFTASAFGEIAEKLVETEPVYIPETMLTKEIAAAEMETSDREKTKEEQKEAASQSGTDTADTKSSASTANQNSKDPNVPGWNPFAFMGAQQVCTPEGNQQTSAPMGGQPMWNPMGGPQIAPTMWGPMGSPQFAAPMYGTLVWVPVWVPLGGVPMTPPPMTPPPMTPPQFQKYLSHPLEKPVDDPNVIKINKAKLAEKKQTPEEALMQVMKGLLPNFNKDEDFFAQGLTSLDTVKMVTRCGEAGYQLELKDIYMYSTFDELLEHLK